MYKILKTIIFWAIILLFFGSSFWIAFLSNYSEGILDIKVNLIDKIPVELWGVVDLIIVSVMIYLFRNS